MSHQLRRTRVWRVVAGAAALMTVAPFIAVSAASVAGAVTAPKLHGYRCTVFSSVPGAHLNARHRGDVVCGLGGNNVLSAGNLSGKVVLIAVKGTNVVKASTAKSSHDTLFGGSGKDQLIGGAGNDTLNAGPGTETLLAKSGQSILNASRGRDVLRGGTGTDTLNGSSGPVTLIAGSSGDDTINVGSGTATIDCGTSATPVTVTGDDSGDHENSDCQNSNVTQAEFRFRGVVTAVGATTITVQYGDVNDAAQNWLDNNGNPTTVTFDISLATVTRDGGGAVQVGDAVRVEANAPTSGTTLPAVTVDAFVHAATEWSGKVTAVAGSIVTISYNDVSDAAQNWLDNNGDPTTVSFDTSSATINREGGGPIAVGDHVHIEANLPSSGTTFVAVVVDAHVEASQRWMGTVSSVTSTTIDVTYSEVSDSARSWLDSHGDPLTVTFDITNAAIDREGGGSITAGDQVEIGANAPATGTTLTALRVHAWVAASQMWVGQVTNVTSTTIDVLLFDENDAAQSWLSDNGSPTTVTFDITAASINIVGGGSSITVGDFAFVRSNPPASGLVIPAVSVIDLPPGSGGDGGGWGGGGGDGGGDGGGGDH